MRRLATLLLLAVSTCALAQPTATHLSLSIVDPSGAFVPDAAINIDRPSHDLHITAKSDIGGYFDIDLGPATYELTITSKGFRPYHKPLQIDATHLVQTKITLDVGGGSSVEVQPVSPLPLTQQHLTSTINNYAPKPIEIKVVVISMFEQGKDTGDVPGEYQFWVERQHLDTVLPFPAGYHDLRLNPQTGVLGLLTGVATARATASVMALGLDPRFDLTHAYFLVAGIAGIDPAMGSLGSAVWSDWIIDADQAHEIDPREIPNATPEDKKLWTTGYIPLGKSTPYEQPRAARFNGDDGNIYHLNSNLVSWAFNLTKNVELTDTDGIKARRMQFDTANPNSPAHRPPFVLRGDNLSGSTFWHGKLLNQWARDWVKYQTDGKGTYAVTGMEDTGTLQSLTWLAKANKVDINRVLVLRTASNFDQQRDGITATASLAETKVGRYSAYIPALESAYRVGHVVVDNLVANWPQARDHIPGKE